MPDLYGIRLSGCDDETELEMELVPWEAELLSRVSVLSEEASTYGCMPTFHLTKKEPTNVE